jgi:Flp pilus assembly protein TadG
VIANMQGSEANSQKTGAAARSVAARRRPVLWRAAGADRRGSAAFEFTLLLPIMMSLAFGTIQYSMLYYNYIAMTGAARYAASTVARGDRSVTSAEAVARTMLPPWVPAADYTVTITDAATGGDVTAQISVDGAKAAVIPYLPVPTPVTITPQMRFQKLPT